MPKETIGRQYIYHSRFSYTQAYLLGAYRKVRQLRNIRITLALSIILVIGIVGSALNDGQDPIHILREAFGQQISSQPVLSAGVSVSGNANPSGFVHGEVAHINGWSNGYVPSESTGLLPTPDTNFTIDIVNPGNVTILHAKLAADNQGNVFYSLPISSNFTFGEYDILYTVESKGYKTITPYSPDLDVHYVPSRFFVVWSTQDIIAPTTSVEKSVQDNYKFKIMQPSLNDARSNMTLVQFGSGITLNATLCPPLNDLISNTSFVDTYSHISTHDSPPTPSIAIVTDFLPLDKSGTVYSYAEKAPGTIVGQDTCSDPFQISSGVLAASDKWSVNATAYFIPQNDTTHVVALQSNRIIFEVANRIYGSNNVTPIKLDQTKYHNTVPLDWSPDGRSILFAYQSSNASADRQKMGILSFDTHNITELNPFARSLGSIVGEPSISQAKFISPSGNKILILYGGDLFAYNLSQNTTERLTYSGSVSNFGVTSDSHVLYNENGNWVLSDSELKNSKAISVLGKYSVGIAISPDGTKVAYRKSFANDNSQTASEVLAYYDLTLGKEFVIPNTDHICGPAPVWAPNGYDIVYTEESCTRGWPGGILWMTDTHGGFKETIVPASNDRPTNYIFSPDGKYLLFCFDYSNQAPDNIAQMIGGPADFYLMDLATPVPEFPFPMMELLIGAVLSGIISMSILTRKKGGSQKK